MLRPLNARILDCGGRHVFWRVSFPLRDVALSKGHELIQLELLDQAAFLQGMDGSSDPVLRRPFMRPFLAFGEESGTKQFLDLDSRCVPRLADVDFANEVFFVSRFEVAEVACPRRAIVVFIDEKQNWLGVSVM
jgi:hypothetical protein